MFPTERDLFISGEQHRDRLQRAEYRRQLRAAGQLRTRPAAFHRAALAWLGTQLVRVGARLQSYGGVRPAVTIRRVTDIG